MNACRNACHNLSLTHTHTHFLQFYTYMFTCGFTCVYVYMQVEMLYKINENRDISSKTTHIGFHKKSSIQSWHVCVRGQWSAREKRSHMCILDTYKEPRLRERSDFSAEINKCTYSGKETNSHAYCRRRCSLVSLDQHQYPSYQIPWLSRHRYQTLWYRT